MLQVRGLTKKFGKQVANRDIDLDCAAGEISILLGPNGAGKSTAIKCILGLLRYEGEVTIGGFPGRSNEAKKILGYVPEFPALYGMLTVEEQIEFIIRAYNLDREAAEQYAEELIQRFRLTERRKYLCKNLSKGMQQKVSIICALLPRPKLLLLDEPMIGLDPHAIKQLRDIVLTLKKQGVAIVVSTHMIASVEGIWDKAYILSRGRVISCHSKAALQGLETASLEKIFFEETERPEILAPKPEPDSDKASKSKKKRTSGDSGKGLPSPDNSVPSKKEHKEEKHADRQTSEEILTPEKLPQPNVPSAFSEDGYLDPDLDPGPIPHKAEKKKAEAKPSSDKSSSHEKHASDKESSHENPSHKDPSRPAPPKKKHKK